MSIWGKAKDRETRAKKSYATRTREQLRTHSCYTHDDKECEGSKSEGSRSGRVQSSEHFIMQSMAVFLL